MLSGLLLLCLSHKNSQVRFLSVDPKFGTAPVAVIGEITASHSPGVKSQLMNWACVTHFVFSVFPDGGNQKLDDRTRQDQV